MIEKERANEKKRGKESKKKEGRKGCPLRHRKELEAPPAAARLRIVGPECYVDVE